MADGLALAGVIVGGVAAAGSIAAVVAAVWAGKLTKAGNEAADDDRRKSAESRSASIRPRPKISYADTVGNTDARVSFNNPGGAAVSWHLLLLVEDTVVSTISHCAANQNAQFQGPLQLIGSVDSPIRGFRVLASVALDVDGAWWDVIKDVRAPNGPDEVLTVAMKAVGVERP